MNVAIFVWLCSGENTEHIPVIDVFDMCSRW